MKQILILAILLALPATADAGHRSGGKVALRSQRITFRQQKLASGVTLTRARTVMYSAQAVANVTGFFTPFGFIANLMGR